MIQNPVLDPAQFLPESDFWQQRLAVNATAAIYHQWEQLEASGCIDNFRITAKLKEGFREGFFFADSDAYKWLDAASRIYASTRDSRLKRLMDDFAIILQKAQATDGYLYTFNQLFFPEKRWDTLQVGHELYCLGHLIEAGISHYMASGEDCMLVAARKAADLLVRKFMDSTPLYTDGHEEIEIALIKLSRCTGNPDYRELARSLLERRGRIKGYPIHFLRQTLRMGGRMRKVARIRERYYRAHPEKTAFKLPQHNRHKVPMLTPLRFLVSALSGKYTQQHTPLQAEQTAEGHAVRFTYLNSAAAMLVRDEYDDHLITILERTWESMVARRMYVTGGLGALTLVEGFGRDYELPPESAYAETCAALGSLFWNHEMSLITRKAKYADLFEWQLYNAALVGMGLSGKSYFYNNPLTCRGYLQRAAWYDIPCCPSNLSRTLASLPGDVLSVDENELTLLHYISGEFALPGGTLQMKSALPWEGRAMLIFELEKPTAFKLNLRIPAWAGEVQLLLNGEKQEIKQKPGSSNRKGSAVDLYFEDAYYLPVQREFRDGDRLEVALSMPIMLRKMDRRIPGCGGMTALTRGPLVYCLESMDNPGDIFQTVIDPESFNGGFDPQLLGGTMVIEGKTIEGESYKWIPYMLWGNRGGSGMTVFFRTSED